MKDERLNELLLGKKSSHDNLLDPILSRIGEVLKNPRDLPYAVEELCEAAEKLDEERKRGLRYALLRVQIDSDLRRQEDLQTMQERKYVAQVLEKLIYGELLLEAKPKKEGSP
jgi:hypothetical protein